MRTMIAGCAAALMMLAGGAGAGIEHTILHGVKVGKVHVWAGPDELPGLSQEQLQNRVESQLREAGVQITPGAPATLFTSVRVHPVQGCFAEVESALLEEAKLERNGFLVKAESWHGGATVLTRPLDECALRTHEAVERLVSDFVEMYGAMNPSAD